MMKYLALVLLCVSISCGKPDGGQNASADSFAVENANSAGNEEIKFGAYAKLIPQLDLPFKFSCDSGLAWPDLDYESAAIKKFKPEGASILGKIYQTDHAVGILYTYPADIIFPVVHVSDMDGHELKRMDLFELGDCVSEMGYAAVTRGFITRDLKLLSWIEVISCDDNGEKCDTTRSRLERVIN